MFFDIIEVGSWLVGIGPGGRKEGEGEGGRRIRVDTWIRRRMRRYRIVECGREA